MRVRWLTARQAAAALRGTPYYGYGHAPGYAGNTPFGVVRLLVEAGPERYYLQAEITAARTLNAYFPNMYGGLVPLQHEFTRINDAWRALDRFAVGETYELSDRPYAGAVARTPLEGGLSAALLPLPATYDAYLRAVGDKSRNMIRKPEKNGFRIAPFDKNAYLDDIYAIHTSLDVRQGQPLQPHYRLRPHASFKGRAAWELVGEEWWGAFSPEGRLVGYIYLPGTNGEYLTSRIMGHGDFLKFGIMNALVAAVVQKHAGERGHILYGMYEHGTDGLRRFKDSMGFRPVPLRRYAFGPGSSRGRVVVAVTAAAATGNPRTRLRDWSKRHPALRDAVLAARGNLQRVLRRRRRR